MAPCFPSVLFPEALTDRACSSHTTSAGGQTNSQTLTCVPHTFSVPRAEGLAWVTTKVQLELRQKSSFLYTLLGFVDCNKPLPLLLGLCSGAGNEALLILLICSLQEFWESL